MKRYREYIDGGYNKINTKIIFNITFIKDFGIDYVFYFCRIKLSRCNCIIKNNRYSFNPAMSKIIMDCVYNLETYKYIKEQLSI